MANIEIGKLTDNLSHGNFMRIMFQILKLIVICI